MRGLVLSSVLLLISCGTSSEPTGTSSETPPPPSGCAAGELTRDDGTCQPAGLPSDAPCAPGEWQREGGPCAPAGVPSDGCASGFTSDGDGGCDPVLPSRPCPPGKMAVPGESACRDVAPCGTAPWGDIPVDAQTEYVDAGYTGGGSDGSAAAPWTTISDGVDAAPTGGIVAIAAGTYTEDVRIVQTSVRLWGRCPSMVEVVGVGGELAAIAMGLADGIEVHGIAITGPKGGVGLTGTLDVVVDRVRIDDTGGRSLEISAALGPSSIALTNSLLESGHEVGLYVSGSMATVSGSVFRGTLPTAGGNAGRGLSVQDGADGPAVVELSGSVVEGNRDVGLFVAGSSVTVDATVIRDTEPDGDGGGRGILAQPGAGISTLVLRGSVIDGNTEAGVFLSGTDAEIDSTVVRRTRLTAEGNYGRGIEVNAPELPSKLDLRASMVRDNHQIGLLVGGSDVVVEGTVIRDTGSTTDGGAGRGIAIQPSARGSPSTVSLRGSILLRNREYALDAQSSNVDVASTLVTDTLPNDSGEFGLGLVIQGGSDLRLHGSVIERPHDLAVLVEASTATIESSVIRDVRQAALVFGRGVQVQASDGAPGSLVLHSTRIEGTFEAGVVVVDSAATVTSCVVSDSKALAASGLFGDGMVVVSGVGNATATVTGTRIENSARAAISSFASAVTIGGSDLVCQAFDLDGEASAGMTFTWTDQGDNRCGCPQADGACVAVTSQIAPPTSVDPPPGL